MRTQLFVFAFMFVGKWERMGGVALHCRRRGASEGTVSLSQGVVVIVSASWSGWVRTQEMERARRRGQGR